MCFIDLSVRSSLAWWLRTLLLLLTGLWGFLSLATTRAHQFVCPVFTCAATTLLTLLTGLWGFLSLASMRAHLLFAANGVRFDPQAPKCVWNQTKRHIRGSNIGVLPTHIYWQSKLTTICRQNKDYTNWRHIYI